MHIHGEVELSGSKPLETVSNGLQWVTATSSVVRAANPNRRYLLLTNDGDVEIYIRLGSTAFLNNSIRLNPGGGSYEMTLGAGNIYTGAVYGIHGSTGNKGLLYVEGS